jgi:hypothetical protein
MPVSSSAFPDDHSANARIPGVQHSGLLSVRIERRKAAVDMTSVGKKRRMAYDNAEEQRINDGRTTFSLNRSANIIVVASTPHSKICTD